MTRSGRPLRIAVIGAGASGVMAAIELKRAGHDDVVVFEKAESLGGTWRDNTYPGLTCDVPSHAYRYSFAPNPDWSQTCSSGDEILAYVARTAERFGVAGLIRYGEEVTQAMFEDHGWRLATSRGDQGRFDVVITATGVLHHPVYPNIPGLEDYQGRAFHSARWDHGVDLQDSRLGVIGTGSTATQIVTAAVPVASAVTLFQRTAQWVLPLPNEPIPESDKARYRADAAFIHGEYLRLTSRMNATFAAAMVGANPEVYDRIAQMCADHLDTVRDPELRARLTPDYKVGCKRLVMSADFYEAIQAPNARLVTDRIVRFTRTGLRTAAGETHELDAVVMATGFDTHQFFRPMAVVGPGGRTLDDAWAEGNRSYLTVAVPGFPNFFMIGGPTSPIGNFSWLLTAETQFRYILQLVERLRPGDVRDLAPSKAALDAFNKSVARQLPNTVWASGCSSWYIDGTGHIASWPWTFEKFVSDLAAPDWRAFNLTKNDIFP